MQDGGAVLTLCQHCRGLDACGQGRARPVPPGAPGRAGCGAGPGCTGGRSRGPGPCSAVRSSRGRARPRPGSRGTARGTQGGGSRGEGRGGHHYTLARYKLKHCRAHKHVSGGWGSMESSAGCWSVQWWMGRVNKNKIASLSWFSTGNHWYKISSASWAILVLTRWTKSFVTVKIWSVGDGLWLVTRTLPGHNKAQLRWAPHTHNCIPTGHCSTPAGIMLHSLTAVRAKEARTSLDELYLCHLSQAAG